MQMTNRKVLWEWVRGAVRVSSISSFLYLVMTLALARLYAETQWAATMALLSDILR